MILAHQTWRLLCLLCSRSSHYHQQFISELQSVRGNETAIRHVHRSIYGLLLFCNFFKHILTSSMVDNWYPAPRWPTISGNTITGCKQLHKSYLVGVLWSISPCISFRIFSLLSFVSALRMPRIPTVWTWGLEAPSLSNRAPTPGASTPHPRHPAFRRNLQALLRWRWDSWNS